MSEIILNGLIPNEFDSVIRVVDGEKWAKAEERTAELIACIQPNKLSEDRRGAVADYVQRLIMKCFPCQVFTFGSVPLKTYLPDGDIDVTAFSKNHHLKDTWAIQVRDILESEEANENAEFCVKEVQYIQADVKIVKCLVENIVVDISFNQLGGLCTLCFLEEVDNLINQDHLFKRSIILIKAWCYYESRILGAHHGLISTYALEALVLYIFHVFNNSFAGPLEVLYRFLELFSNFDWENFCVCLWGPVPIGSLPDINVEPPRKDGGELLLSKAFLQACNSVYAVLPGGLEDRGHPFISKHFNIIDPLRINNNLGRSVSKGNFYRIRSAFAFGAKKLGRLLDCPKENIAFELNRFFINTWERHGSGIRPDAPIGILGCLRPSNPNSGSDSCSKPSNSKDCSDSTSMRVNGVGSIPTTRPLLSQRASYPLQSTSISNCNDANGTSNNSRKLDWCDKGISKFTLKADRSHRTLKHEQSVNQLKGKRLFTRTRSSPELTDAYYRDATRLARSKPIENKTRNRPNASDDSASISNSHIEDSSTVMVSQDYASVVGAQGMHQEEQDLINMMASSSLHNFGGHIRMPLNWAPPNLPPSLSQPMLASMGYAQRSMVGMLPANIPYIDPHWAANFQFHQGLTSSSLPQYFPGERVANVEYWNERDVASSGELGVNEGTSDILHADDRQASSSGSSNEIDESVTVSQPSPTLHVGRHQLSEFEESETSGSNSVMPIPPMVLDPGSHRRGPDGSGTRPFTFYPTGPPVPFFTMLPVYNYLAEADSSEPSSSPLVGEEGPGNSDSGQNSESTDQHDALNVLNASNHMRKSSIGELPEEPKRDILNSDFARHWENLQFGRFCQGPQYPAQIVCPPPVAVPPMYLQGHSPWDGPGRPVSANENLLSQLVSHAHPCEPTTVYQKFADEVPRYRNGTGTYLPSPKASTRGRQSSGGRRNNYSYDRNDHSDREGNWNVAKSRRSHNRSHAQNSRADRFTFNENRADTSWGDHRHQPHNGPLRPISSADASYGAHPFPGINLVGVTANRPTMPSVMLYPNDNNPGYVPVSPGEQPELGSLGPSDASQPPDSIQLRGACEDQIYHSSSRLHSSPDQPLSPRF